MPATRTSAFQVGGKKRFFGVSLGNPGAGELPDADMYWAGHTAGWPSGDLANFNKHALLLGRNPDAVRLYPTNAEGTTGVTSSTGQTYGLFTNDWVSIANTGTILVITFKYGSSTAWGTNGDALNAVGTNATKTSFNNIAQNLKRWHDDANNTAPIKKILFGFWHEPTNDGGVGADYVKFWQAMVNYLLNLGVGDGPKPASGPGSTYVGTWYDMLEWTWVQINADLATGGPAWNYYPGDGYVHWALADGYNWAGGQIASGTAATHAGVGQVPQPGDTCASTSHYTNAWKTMQTVADNNFRQWYTAGPGGFRNVLLGFGEFACSEDIERFPIVGGVLTGASNHTGKKNLKGDWIEGARKWFRGEAWTAPDPENNIVTTDGGFGTLITMPIWWHSQAAGPRWWNTLSYLPSDVAGPTATGHHTFDSFVTLVNDDIFGTGPTSHTAPTITTFTASADPGGNGLDWTFVTTVTAGDSAIVSYGYDFGDGNTATDTTSALTDTTTNTYLASGVYTATVTVTDANALVATATFQVVVTQTTPAVSPYAGANLIQQGDDLRKIRFTYNPAVLALESYTALGGASRVVAASGTAQTLTDPRYNRFQDITLTNNCTITLPTAVVGMVLHVIVRQDGTGSRTLTWAAGGGQTLKWPAATAPVQTSTLSSSDEYEFTCVAATVWRGHRVAADVR